MSQTPDQLKELGRIFTAVGNGAQWQFASRTRPETWHEPEPGFSPLRAAEIGYLIRVKPWGLPPPPEGQQWHRGAEFTEADLPEGYRPMLVGEALDQGDEAWAHSEGPWIETKAVGDTLKMGWHAKCRTKRPLPAEDPYAELKAAAAAGKTIQLRDFGNDGWLDINGHPEFGHPATLYRIKPDPVPLGPEDVPPGSVLRSKGWIRGQHVAPSVFLYGVCWTGNTGPVNLTYDQLMHGWEIQRPGEDWKPCIKEPS